MFGLDLVYAISLRSCFLDGNRISKARDIYEESDSYSDSERDSYSESASNNYGERESDSCGEKNN